MNLKHRIRLRDSEPMASRRFPSLVIGGIIVWVVVIKGVLVALEFFHPFY